MQTHTIESTTAVNSRPAAAVARDFNVGEWRVCPDLNRLQHRTGSLQRQLEPRLMHLLCYLAANRNRVLAREELVRELWPRVIVNENSLTRAISELRKQLQRHANSVDTYIETIPKKGYRLLPAMEIVTVPVNEPPELRFAGTGVIPGFRIWGRQPVFRSTMIALSFSLVLATWFGLNHAGLQPAHEQRPVLLADELREDKADYLGGELTLSTMENNPAGLKSIEAPVISNDESQYAYIQHDNSGSTIFLGRLDALTEPVIPVYNSPDKLFNLTWSPLGHSLIFARQAKITTAALFRDEGIHAELISLDLNTLETHRLRQEKDAPNGEATKPLSLT